MDYLFTLVFTLALLVIVPLVLKFVIEPFMALWGGLPGLILSAVMAVCFFAFFGRTTWITLVKPRLQNGTGYLRIIGCAFVCLAITLAIVLIGTIVSF